MLLRLLLVSGLQTPKLMAIFFLVGALAMGYAAIMILRGIQFTRKMQRAGVPAAGLIISQRKVQAGGRGSCETYLIPKVRYQILDGKILEGESRGGSEVEFYDGQEAYLRYDADEPMNFLFVQELNQTQIFHGFVLLLITTLFAMSGIWAALEMLIT